MATAPAQSFGHLLWHYRTHFAPRLANGQRADDAGGLTQEALAERAGVSVNTISALERGDHRGPRRSTVELLAGALDLADDERAAFFGAFEAMRRLDLRSDVGADATNDAGVGARPDACPYRGLHVFDEEHADLFFGRDRDVDRLLEQLDTSRFLAVLGPSGVGKSSLVRAGLVPALRRGALPGSAGWAVRVIVPGAHPLTTLAAHLRHLYPDPGEDMAATLDALRMDERTLHLATARALAGGPASARLVWVVDQGEEAFTLCRDEQERRSFFANLLFASGVSDGRCVVVFALRADFYGHCASDPDLARRMAAHQYLVSPLDRDGLRQVIEQPARRAGLRFKDGLADTILDDVERQPGALPLLEHALLELWMGRRGRTLTLEAYRASGGVQGAVAARAERVYTELSLSQRDVARRVLLRLTQPGEDEQAGDTRRRVWVDELVTAPPERADVDAVVAALVDARLLTTGTEGAGTVENQEWVEVAHEALIRGWDRLRGWIDEDRAGLRVHRRLTEAAREWQRLGHDDDALYRGAALVAALDWRQTHADAPNRLEHEFLAASSALRRREEDAEEESRRRALEDARRLAESERRRAEAAHALVQSERRRARVARRMTVALAILLVAAVLAAAVAVQQRGAALTAQRQAQREQRVAVSRELAANALGQLPVDPELSVLLATRAVRVADTAQADDSLRQALAQSQVRATLRMNAGSVTSAQFSPDGRLVLATSVRYGATLDNTTEIWDARTGRGVALLRGVGTSAAFSPDGRVVATGDANGGVRLWNARTGRRIAALTGHTDFISDVQFSPDGRELVTASSDGTARVWNLRTRRAVAILRAAKERIESAQFSPDGRLIATTSDDGTTRVWDAASGRAVAVMRAAAGLLNLAAFSSDSRYIATINNEQARVWKARTGHLITTLRASDPVGSLVDCLTFTHSGHTVITGGIDQTVRVWNALTGQNTLTLRGHTGDAGGGIVGGINSVAVSPDDQDILSSSTDGTARVWETPGTLLTTLRGHTGSVNDAQFSPDGRFVVTAGADGTARVWQTASLLVRTIYPHAGAVNDAVFSPNGRIIATANGRHTAELWDARTGRSRAILRGDTNIVEGVAFSRDGRVIATGSDDGTVRVWTVPGGRPKAVFRMPGGDLAAAALSLDGRYVVAISGSGAARAWNVRTGRQVAALRAGSGFGFTSGVDISPDDRFAVTGNANDTARIWEVSTGRVVATLRGHSGTINSVAFSPDGRLVATGSDDKTARLWDARTGRSIAVLRGHTGPVRQVVFSPDGRLLLTVSLDLTVRAWQVRTGRLVSVLAGHTGRIESAAFSPNSRLVVTASQDQTARVWNVRTGAQLALLGGNASAVRSAVFSPDGREVLTGSMDGTARVYSCDVCGSTAQLLALARTRVTRSLTARERQRYLHQS